LPILHDEEPNTLIDGTAWRIRHPGFNQNFPFLPCRPTIG